MLLNVLFFMSISAQFVQADQNMTFVAGTNAVLPCEGMASPSDTYIWAEDTFPSETRIYIVTNTVLKTEVAKGIEKYDNFFLNSSYPESADMLIQFITLDDKGSYLCELVIQSRTVSTYNIGIEVPPQSVAITCVDYSTCPISSEDVVSSMFYCTCEAIGAYPDRLTIHWDGATGSPTNASSSVNGQSGTFDFSSQAIFRPHFLKTSMSCYVEGFQNYIDNSLTSAHYIISPPVCSLTAISDESCSMTTLTCSCNESKPDVKSYTFYDDSRSLIGYSVGSDTLENVQIRQDEYETFYCRGCNGLFFGDRSLAQITFQCTVGRTTVKTAPKTDITTSKITTFVDRSTERATLGDFTPERTTLSDLTTERKSPMTADTTERTTLMSGDLTTRTEGTPSLSPEEENPCKTFTWMLVCCVEGLIIAVLILKMIFNKCTKTPKSRSGPVDTKFQEEIDLKDAYEDKIHRDIYDLDIRKEDLREVGEYPRNGFLKYQEAVYNGERVMKKFLPENTPFSLGNVFTAEVKSVMQLPNNRNVVETLGWCNTEPAFLIHKFVEGYNLLEYVKECTADTNEYLNVNAARFVLDDKRYFNEMISMAVQVACGMTFLHRNKFIHPGLRAEKVLVGTARTCKLFSFVSEQRAQNYISVLWKERRPYQWMSPEYLQWGEVTLEDDLWSFGVLFWELVAKGAEPYERLEENEVVSRFHSQHFLERPSNCSNSIWQVITNCWKSPQKRPRMDDITDKVKTSETYEESYSPYNEVEA